MLHIVSVTSHQTKIFTSWVSSYLLYILHIQILVKVKNNLEKTGKKARQGDSIQTDNLDKERQLRQRKKTWTNKDNLDK